MSSQYASVYVFVRLDLPLAQQLVQLGHAVYGMAALWVPAELGKHAPNMIICGLPNLKTLQRVARRCMQQGVPHYAWSEPDDSLGFTALCTVPIEGWQRDLFKNYKLWSWKEYVDVLNARELQRVHASLDGALTGARQSGAVLPGLVPARLDTSENTAPLNTPVAQLLEQRISNAKVEGVNPSRGAKIESINTLRKRNELYDAALPADRVEQMLLQAGESINTLRQRRNELDDAAPGRCCP